MQIKVVVVVALGNGNWDIKDPSPFFVQLYSTSFLLPWEQEHVVQSLGSPLQLRTYGVAFDRDNSLICTARLEIGDELIMTSHSVRGEKTRPNINDMR